MAKPKKKLVKKNISNGKKISEAKTRELFIDKQLAKEGWLKKYIKDEVNSVRSNFKEKDYILSEGEGDKSGRFIDYLLLAEDNSPLAFIEAKRFSASEDKGRVQARTYLDDIRKQTGEEIPYFLTNGNKWLLIDQDGNERHVSKPFSQSDLMRRRELYLNREDLTKVDIGKIVDRGRSIITVKKILEHIQDGHRSALISMATGTGKTRVAMAIIDVLLRARIIRNVLFVVDRIPLADNAKEEGFKEFFSEAVTDLREHPESFPDGFYVTTIQTLRYGKKGQKSKYYEKFSSGFFDLVIFDEAHRSIYDPNKEVHRYFDAIRIGLTATPSEKETRNTFDLFGCTGKNATVEYQYDDAVNDKVLVPYKAEIIDTNVLTLGIKGSKLTKEIKTQLKKQEEDPDAIELPASTFARIFMDDKTNELIIREFLSRCKKSDDGKPAKTIFFCASVKHTQHLKKLFGKIIPRLNKDVQQITSDKYRYRDELRRFKLDSEPRIALSVGVLDTGVNIPEVCNLVFVKPVFSPIRFWQMLGRGTRNQKACKHLEWLPNKEKNDFLIMDFTIGGHSNVKVHSLKQAQEKSAGDNVQTKIFSNRVELLKKNLKPKQKKLIEKKILNDIENLDKDSFIVREKLHVIKKVVKKKFELKDYIKELKKEIAPLMALNPSDSSLISTFILQIERLFKHVYDNDTEKIFKVMDSVREKMENILQKDHLEIIQEKREDILKVFEDTFWDEITFDDVEFIIKELAPLMIYYEVNPTRIIQVDAPDVVISIEKFEYETKEDTKLKEFFKTNPILKKIREEKGITSAELLKLEKELSKINPNITIDQIQRIQKTDFILFLRKIMGMTHDYDPQEMIEREFDKHVIESNKNYNSSQIEFLGLLKKIFARTKKVEIKDFTEAPLSNERPLDKFQVTELQKIVAKCGKIRMK
jgi:type I restriction enzyme, R subunit